MRYAIGLTLFAVTCAFAAPQKEELPTGAIARLGTSVAPPKNEPIAGEVNALFFVNDKTLLAGTNSGWTSWNIAARQTGQPKPVGGPAFAFVRDSERLWVGSAKKLHAIEPAESASLEPSRSWDSASDQVNVIALDASTGRLVYADGDRTLTLLDANTGKPMGTIVPTSRPVSASLTAHGRVLAVVTRDGAARHFILSSTGKLEPLWTKRVARSNRVAADFSTDGRLYAVSSAGRIRVLESTTGQQLYGLERRFGDGDVRCLAISKDCRFIAAGNDAPQAVVRVWSLDTGLELATFKGHLGSINAVAFSPDGTTLASAGNDCGILLWKVPPAPPAKKAVPLQEGWDTLDTMEAKDAHTIIGSFLADPKQAVKTLGEGFQDSAGEQKRILRWIRELDHDEFRVREVAKRSLSKIGLRAAAYLTDPKRKPLRAEGEQSVRFILEGFETRGLRVPEGGLYGEELRSVRAVRLLETIGTLEARALLEQVAKNEKESRLTREAKSALSAWPTR